ncbi:MAG TPA: ATP-binding cassette domain-containing protein, partial [Bdellovibrionales bacterium]|nr:ATP-binding cassette domain-containing protein [Bdellovibrionales bacterium]
MLRLTGIQKRFPGVHALKGVDFELKGGEIHALMGENGAGKSTLIKVLTGAERRDDGRMELDGRAVEPRSTLEAQSLGISPVYQEINLIPSLSVAENLYLGRQPTRLGFVRWGAMKDGARRALKRLELDLDVSRPLASYSTAIQQMVAITRALEVSAKYLILDEPTSSLDANEVRQLFKTMKQLRDEGLGILFVTHFLDQVYEVSDRITVLRNGALVGVFKASELSREQLVAKMMGRELTAFQHETAKPGAARAHTTFLKARGLSRKNAIAPF